MRRPYRKLNLVERRTLATMLQAKATKTKIAETLGRDRLNNTPRKCLGWKTPAEVFRENMLAEMGRSPYSQKQ